MEYKGWVERVFSEQAHIQIVEIGVYRGEFAARLLRSARIVAPHAKLAYCGIDLFGQPNPRPSREENTLPAPSVASVHKRLLAEFPDAEIELLAGDSQNVLPTLSRQFATADLVYIDGGHAVATIASDWACVSSLTRDGAFIIFDDYYEGREDIGSKPIVDSIDRSGWSVELTDSRTYETQLGILHIRQAVVRKRQRFRPASLQEARASILESLDGAMRGWAEETARTICLLRPFLTPSTRVCDLGCGVGRLGTALAPLVHHVDGVDSSPEMLALQEDEVRRQGIGNMRGLRTADWLSARHAGPYDLFLAIFVLQHVPRPELLELLDALSAKARPGARLCVVNTPGRFLPTAQGYVDDGLDIRAVLAQRFPLLEPLPVALLGEHVERHHFGQVYSICDAN